jgi:hypothetical protein
MGEDVLRVFHSRELQKSEAMLSLMTEREQELLTCLERASRLAAELGFPVLPNGIKLAAFLRMLADDLKKPVGLGPRLASDCRTLPNH